MNIVVGCLLGSVSVRENIPGKKDEKTEVEQYEQDIEWLHECRKGFMEWYNKSKKAQHEQKKVCKMFHFIS